LEKAKVVLERHTAIYDALVSKKPLSHLDPAQQEVLRKKGLFAQAWTAECSARRKQRAGV
jgi:hypothetical protein